MKSTAPAKLILFGEHSVVYNKLGIATAIDLYTTANAKFTKKIVVNDRNNLMELSFEELKNLLEKIKKLQNENKIEKIIEMQKKDYRTATKVVVAKAIKDLRITEPFNLEITSDIPIASGLGSGSSAFAAISGALQKLVGNPINRKTVEKHSYLGDVVCHGRPSGIDNNAITYGGYIKFKKLKGVEPLKINTTLPVVIGNSGAKGSTAELVQKVRGTPGKEEIFEKMDKIANEVLVHIKNGNLQETGKLMNENQKCLRDLGVSHPKLEQLIEIAIENKAYGAKITGAGGGGNMYALCKNKEHQKQIIKAFQNEGYSAYLADIGVEGTI